MGTDAGELADIWWRKDAECAFLLRLPRLWLKICGAEERAFVCE